MARQSTKILAANESAHTISVVAPKGNASITINTAPGSHLNLDFDPTEADYSRQGTDLVFAFPEGNTVTLEGFFAVGSEPLPSFILPDGTPVTAERLLTDIDISPTAGSSAAGQEGSEIGEYNDDAGVLIGSVGHIANTVFNTGEGSDYAQAQDASLGSLFTREMDDGNDMLALSVDVCIASGASLSGGDGYDTLFIGNLDSLNGTDVFNSGLGLSQLDGIMSGFEALDMTGGDGTSLKIDVNGLDWMGIDSGNGFLFTGDGLFDVTLLGSDNVLLVKGDSADHVDFSGSGWNATGNTITADNIAYDVYSNSLNEYILVQ